MKFCRIITLFKKDKSFSKRFIIKVLSGSTTSGSTVSGPTVSGSILGIAFEASLFLLPNQQVLALFFWR